MGIEFNRILNTEEIGLNGVKIDLDLITCPLCRVILNNPAMCGVCRAHICYDCLKEYRER